MKDAGKKSPGLLFGIAAVLCIVIGLLIFLRSSTSVPDESAQSQEPPSPQGTPVESKSQAQPASTLATKQPVDMLNISGVEESPEARVSGIVRNEKGEPMAGAAVHALQVDSAAKRYDATTAAENGTYTLKGLHIGNPFPHKIVASAPGYAPTSSAAFALDGPSKEINISLLKGVPVGGRLTTADGEGIAGATVSLMESSRVTAGWIHFYTDYDGVVTATTGAEGRYSFPNVSTGEYWLYVCAPKYFDEEKLFTISPGNDSVTVDFMMNYAGEQFVAGTVVDEESGQPIEGARVECRDGTIQESEHRIIRRTCYTSAEGKFFVNGFSYSHPSIQVSKHGYNKRNPQTHGPNRNELDMHDLKIPLKSWGYSLGSPNSFSGRIFDSTTDKPISEFKIAVLREDEEVYFVTDRRYYCDCSRAFRSPDGGFLIPKIAAGRVSLMVSASGYATRRIPCFIYPKTVSDEVRKSLRDRGREDDLKNHIEIRLEQGATVSGTAYDLQTQEPVPGVRVDLCYDHGWMHSHRIGPISLGAFTDEQGGYRLEGIPEGAQWIIASYPGYAPAFSGELQFSWGEERAGLDFFLDPGGAIEGSILDDFNRQDGVMITLQSIDSPVLLKKVRGNYENRFLGPSRVVQTDEGGHYRADGLTPGYWYVRTQFWSTIGRRRGWDVQVNKVVEVQEGKTTIFDIPVCGGTIKGTILFDKSFRSDPKKQEGYYAWLREANAPPIELGRENKQIIKSPIRQEMNRRSEDHWIFRFEGICAGEYTVTILRYERHGSKFVDQRSAPVAVREYGVANVTIDFRSEGLAGLKNYGSKLIESLK